MRVMIVVAGSMLLAGCGGGGEAPAKKEVAAQLGAGLYEMTGEVKSIASADGKTPATKHKVGDKIAAKACVAADGALDPALFAEGADKCTRQSNYARKGKMSIQLSCQRAGDNGNVLVLIDGKFTADSFEGKAESATQFYGEGDYRMTRNVTGKRVGDCPAVGAAPAAS